MGQPKLPELQKISKWDQLTDFFPAFERRFEDEDSRIEFFKEYLENNLLVQYNLIGVIFNNLEMLM